MTGQGVRCDDDLVGAPEPVDGNVYVKNTPCTHTVDPESLTENCRLANQSATLESTSRLEALSSESESIGE